MYVDSSGTWNAGSDERLTNTQRAVLTGCYAFIVTVLLLTAFLVFQLTYTFGDYLYPILPISLSFLLELFIFYLIFTFIYLIICCIIDRERCCQSRADCKSCGQDCCGYTCKVTFCIYLCQLALWYLILSVTVTLYHPFWAGPIDIIFPDNESGGNDAVYNSEDVTLRVYFQTVEYSGEILKPNNAGEIVDIILDNYDSADDTLIRSVGSGHSSSPLFSNDIIVSLENMKNYYIDTGAETVTCGAGAIVEDIEDALYDVGYVLIGFGNQQAQTMGGMLGTGVYGAYGSMTRNVNTVWLVDGNGFDLKINASGVFPTDDDSNSVSSGLNSDDFNQTTFLNLYFGDANIEDSDWLNAIKVNVGVLGIIYQISFDIEPTFSIKKNEIKYDYGDINGDYVSLLFPKDTDASDTSLGNKLSITMVDVDNKDKQYVLTKYEESTEAETVTHYDINNFLRDVYNYWVLFTPCIDYGLISLSVETSYAFIVGMSDEDVVDDKDIYNVKSSLRSDKLFHGGYIYNVRKEVCNDALEELIELSNDVREGSDNSLTFTVVTQGLTKNEANGFLSYMYDSDVCLIELYPNICTNNRVELAEEFEEIVRRYNGSAHWGKQFLDYENFYQTRYYWSEFDRFNSIRGIMDPNNLFLNDYLKNIFEYDEDNVEKIEYKLIDQYSKNSVTFTATTYTRFILPGLITVIIGVLQLFDKIPHILDANYCRYETRKAGAAYCCLIVFEIVVAIIVIVIAQASES